MQTSNIDDRFSRKKIVIVETKHYHDSGSPSWLKKWEIQGIFATNERADEFEELFEPRKELIHPEKGLYEIIPPWDSEEGRLRNLYGQNYTAKRSYLRLRRREVSVYADKK